LQAAAAAAAVVRAAYDRTLQSKKKKKIRKWPPPPQKKSSSIRDLLDTLQKFAKCPPPQVVAASRELAASRERPLPLPRHIPCSIRYALRTTT
jgi:hypothetical protein